MSASVSDEARVILAREDVQVWCADLDLDDAAIGDLAGLLTADERVRAGRYHFEHDRRRFVVARARLRAILTLYLGGAPGDVMFAVDARGRPRLTGAAAGGLEFSVSHSGGRALFALTRQRRVGVDLERIEEGIDWEPVATRFFSSGEVAGLRALPSERRAGEFFRVWTRKEAWVKARGDGLGACESLLRDGAPDVDGDAWSTLTIDAGPGYAAALALARR